MKKKIESLKELNLEIKNDYEDNSENLLLSPNSQSPFSPSSKNLKKKPKNYIKKIRSSPSFQSIPLTKSLSNLSFNSLNKFNQQNDIDNFINKDINNLENNENYQDDNIGYCFEQVIGKNNIKEDEEIDFFDDLDKNQYSEPKLFLTKKIKKKNNEKIKEEDEKSNITTSTTKSSKNQLFHENPPIELVKNIMKIFLGENLDNPCYQFTRKMLEEKNILEKIENYIPELRKYYLKCKQNKYLDNLDSKKIITIFRQLVRIYGYQVHSTEKYQNGSKFLLYKIDKINEQKKNNKTNFTVDFD
jgi:hypothetical protein